MLPIGNQRQVSVRGKIDRLDTVTLNGDEYFLVIDYKSSKHVFTPLEAYYGVAMQMLTYIDAVENDLDEKGVANKPAGALYMHMHKKPVAYDQNPDKLQIAHQKAYKLQGLLVLPDDQDQALNLAKQFDAGLADAGFTSNIVQIGTKKNGEFSARTHAISQDALALYLNHNRQSIIHAAQQILAGNIALAPLQFKSEATVITQSDYQAIMLFDPATEHDRYHHVDSLDVPTIMANMRKEAEDHA